MAGRVGIRCQSHWNHDGCYSATEDTCRLRAQIVDLLTMRPGFWSASEICKHFWPTEVARSNYKYIYANVLQLQKWGVCVRAERGVASWAILDLPEDLSREEIESWLAR